MDNATNRLISVTDGVSTTTYAYNGDGDRISQDIDGTLTTYRLDIATPLTMVLSETTGIDTIYYLHGLGLVAESDSTTVDYFTYDGLGSVRQLTDSAATLLLTQTFDPYGNPYANAGSGQSAFGYAGEQTDSNGLLYLRARYYNPSTGRFLNMDPSRQEMNPYQYSLSNPILYTDPSGQFIQFAIPLIPVLVIAAVAVVLIVAIVLIANPAPTSEQIDDLAYGISNVVDDIEAALPESPTVKEEELEWLGSG